MAVTVYRAIYTQLTNFPFHQSFVIFQSPSKIDKETRTNAHQHILYSTALELYSPAGNSAKNVSDWKTRTEHICCLDMPWDMNPFHSMFAFTWCNPKVMIVQPRHLVRHVSTDRIIEQIIKAAVKALKRHSIELSRDPWLEEASACEKWMLFQRAVRLLVRVWTLVSKLKIWNQYGWMLLTHVLHTMLYKLQKLYKRTLWVFFLARMTYLPGISDMESSIEFQTDRFADCKV